VSVSLTEKRPGGRRVRRDVVARPRSGPVLHLAGLGAGAVLTGLAWLYLVGAAIDFGLLAVRGERLAWVFMLGASLGAVVCLVLMLALLGRGLRSVGVVSDYRPKRAGGRRRR
jgi:hypothetical protein